MLDMAWSATTVSKRLPMAITIAISAAIMYSPRMRPAIRAAVASITAEISLLRMSEMISFMMVILHINVATIGRNHRSEKMAASNTRTMHIPIVVNAIHSDLRVSTNVNLHHRYTIGGIGYKYSSKSEL